MDTKESFSMQICLDNNNNKSVFIYPVGEEQQSIWLSEEQDGPFSQ
jgi:hypothetical protein